MCTRPLFCLAVLLSQFAGCNRQHDRPISQRNSNPIEDASAASKITSETGPDSKTSQGIETASKVARIRIEVPRFMFGMREDEPDLHESFWVYIDGRLHSRNGPAAVPPTMKLTQYNGDILFQDTDGERIGVFRRAAGECELSGVQADGDYVSSHEVEISPGRHLIELGYPSQEKGLEFVTREVDVAAGQFESIVLCPKRFVDVHTPEFGPPEPLLDNDAQTREFLAKEQQRLRLANDDPLFDALMEALEKRRAGKTKGPFLSLNLGLGSSRELDSEQIAVLHNYLRLKHLPYDSYYPGGFSGYVKLPANLSADTDELRYNVQRQHNEIVDKLQEVATLVEILREAGRNSR